MSHHCAGVQSPRVDVPRRGRVPRLLAVAGLMVAAVAAAGIPGGGASAAPGQDEETEERVRDLDDRSRDLVYRVRDLTYRSRAVDNSERVEEAPEQTSIALSADVLFEFDQAVLTEAANTRLDELADQLSDLGPREVTIGGHTDDHGEPAYNQDLSERRAEAVRAALDERLDDEFSFVVTGHGETEPVAPNQHPDGSDNPEGRAVNRRVEISFRS
jgi:outer membrane protein OmpA-like peptidoglycan-associated protein